MAGWVEVVKLLVTIVTIFLVGFFLTPKDEAGFS